ncbi:uncharacterized protein LOC123265941 [Cotesia glomerata]|uniref:uncharacterized protein LOC123265941 n=1 Tax=Cotesia glomerata TaxID=32391 RepID=UPI001D0179DE|nr:uncharacterized protein LOC123265941 [Cotesia glomerata]
MTDDSNLGKAGSLNPFQRRVDLNRSSSAGDLSEVVLSGKRKDREGEIGLRLERDRAERDIIKRSRLIAKSPNKKIGLTEEEMEEILKKLGGIETKISEECGKVSKRVDELKEEGRKERAELRKIWEEDKKRMNERMDGLESRLEKIEMFVSRRGNGEGDTLEVAEGRMDEEAERRLRKMELEIEKREREVRRKNVILKGIDMKPGVDLQSEVEKVWEKMEIVGGRKNMRKIGNVDKEGRGLLLIELEGNEKKKEVMKAKSKLKGEKIRVDDDLTFEEGE